MDQDAIWYGSRPRPRSHCVRWGPDPPLPKKGPKPPILAHVCCGQMARWIKMPLGTEVGLGPDHIVLDGDPALPLQRGTAPPPPSIFGPCLLWAHGWMDQDGTWCGGRPSPKRHCVRWRPSSPQKRYSSPPSFRPMSIVANGHPSQLLLSTC